MSKIIDVLQVINAYKCLAHITYVKGGEHMSNPKNNTDVSIAKYVSVLEDYHRLSKEHKELEEQFQKEYDFAESRVKELEIYNEFINSNEDIKKSFDEFIKNLSKEEK